MKTKRRQRSGDLQIAVMQVLWEQGRATLAEIRAALRRDRPLAATTVATVLSRLVRSGLVSRRSGDGAHVYAPKIDREDFRRLETRSFIERLFGGHATDLIAHLVRESEIDDDELAQLRTLLRKGRH